jgi:hypothetical protein
MTPARRALFTIALQLEEGELPWVEQHGYAFFDPVDAADHRIVRLEAAKGEKEEHVQQPSTEGAASGAAERSTGRSAAAEAEEAEAGSAVRRQGGRRLYSNVGDVMDEDRWELGVVFPEFSPPIFDPNLRLFFREGVIQPLRWWPARYGVRLYYEDSPWLLPIVRVAPEPPPRTPHIFQMTRNGMSFRALCYTFAPDGTVARGRGWDDTAAEVLRQVVVWLTRYLVWVQFKFFPGVGVGHDPTELLGTVTSDAPCPYHADRPYGRCCRPRHEAEVKRRARRPMATGHLEHGILNPSARRPASAS